MSSSAAPNNIILYNYAFSPFGKRISTYLALRRIDYAICEQPFIMPRPDLQLLPLAYRRIPILAIGRDIYLDTRLILSKLESLFPSTPTSPSLAATSRNDKFITMLLQKYMIEGPVFGITAGLISVDVAADASVREDRQGFLGKDWSKEQLEGEKGECLAYLRELYGVFEGVLGDGRSWVLGERVGLGDVEAIWPFEFSSDMQLPPELISQKQFPKVFAWLARYRAAREEAQASAPKPTALDGQAAAEHILGSDFGEPECSVDDNDPLGLKKGTEVELYPGDWGSEYRDRGRLVGLNVDEVVIDVKSKGNGDIRIHAPRTGFKIKEIGKK